MHASYFEEILTENLQTLDHMSGGPLICVENHRLGSIARTVLEHLLSEKNHIALCLDIPKSMKAWNTPDPGQQQFFEAHADSVQEIHLHDLDESHSHLVPGQGGIDFGRFTELLCREIPWTTIEVRPAPLAAKGKDWLEDFRRRHKQPR